MLSTNYHSCIFSYSKPPNQHFSLTISFAFFYSHIEMVGMKFLSCFKQKGTEVEINRCSTKNHVVFNSPLTFVIFEERQFCIEYVPLKSWKKNLGLVCRQCLSALLKWLAKGEVTPCLVNKDFFSAFGYIQKHCILEIPQLSHRKICCPSSPLTIQRRKFYPTKGAVGSGSSNSPKSLNSFMWRKPSGATHTPHNKLIWLLNQKKRGLQPGLARPRCSPGPLKRRTSHTPGGCAVCNFPKGGPWSCRPGTVGCRAGRDVPLIPTAAITSV